MDISEESALVTARSRLQDAVRDFTDSVTAKLVDFTVRASARYQKVLWEHNGSTHTVEKAVSRNGDWEIEFNDAQTQDLTGVAYYLMRIAELTDGSQEYATLYDWATAYKQDVPSIIEVFVIPMLMPREFTRQLPWTEEGDSDEEAQSAFADNARTSMTFMEREGCTFIVQLILSSLWENNRDTSLWRSGNAKITPFITVPKAMYYAERRNGAAFYGVAPLQTGIPHLLSRPMLESCYNANSSESVRLVNRIYTRLLSLLFGTEMPFCSVEQKRRDWVASSLIDFTPDDGVTTAQSNFISFLLFELDRDYFLSFAPLDFDERQVYIARNIWNQKYGSRVLEAFVNAVKSDKSQSLKYIIAAMWYVILDKAMTENDTYMEDALAILGNKPTRSELTNALKLFNPARRDLAVKLLLKYGIHVPHNALGDIAVVARLASEGVVPAASTISKWPAETRQWYVEHVVLSQAASTSDAVDRAFEPV